MSTYIIDLISHLTLRKIGLTRIKTLSPPMDKGYILFTVSEINAIPYQKEFISIATIVVRIASIRVASL